MKGIVTLSVILSLCIGLVWSEAGSKDEQSKQLYNNLNAIGSTPKPDLFSYQQITQQYGEKYQPQQAFFQQQYQQRTQHLQQALPYNHQPEPTKKPYLYPQNQATPVAMVIIAQPAYVPVSMLQHGNVAQQLLQYFQGNNRQNRYQFIPANHQPVYQQPNPSPMQNQQLSHYLQYSQSINKPELPSFQPSATSAPSAQAQTGQTQWEALPTPQALLSQQSQQHQVTPPNFQQEGRSLHYHRQQQPNEYQPQQLQQLEQQTEYQSPDISKLAQQAAQHFLTNGGLNSGSRTAPAIITGLEHFSPEQQEKIKEQLSQHFGSPLKPLNLEGQGTSREQQESSISSRKYYQDRRQKIKRDRFVPSIQVKDGEITQILNNAGDKM